MQRPPKVCVITNMCPHYRVKLFARLINEYGFRFYLFDEREGTREEVSHLKIFKGGDGQYILHPLKILRALWRERFDVIIKCTNNKWLFIATFVLAKLVGARFVVWHSLWYYPDTLQYRFFGRFFEALLKRYTHAIVVYGEHGKKFLERKGIEPGKIFVASQAVDNDLYGKMVGEGEIRKMRDRYGIEEQKKIVLFVGRFAEEKGIRCLLDALSRLNRESFTFLAVGEGVLREEMELFLTEKGVDFRVAGLLPYDDLPSVYKMATVMVLPSITTRTVREPWGLVVNEAFNQGCPAIVTDAVGAGVGGLVTDGFTGIIVPERESYALAQAIDKIMKDKNFRNVLSENAREEIKKWTYERQAEGFVNAVKFVSGEDIYGPT